MVKKKELEGILDKLRDLITNKYFPAEKLIIKILKYS